MCYFFLNIFLKKFGERAGTFGMRQHSVTTHPEELEKIPNFFSKIKKSLDEEENIHFKSQFEKIEENSLWNFYKPSETNQNDVICKFCNKLLSMVNNYRMDLGHFK